MHVDLRCLDGLMSEPQRDDRSIHAILEQVHRRRVTQDVRTYALPVQRCARFGSCRSVFSDDLLHGVAAEPAASYCREDPARSVIASTFSKPCFDCVNRISAKRRTALLAPFAFATDVRARAERHIPAVKIDRLLRHASRFAEPEAGSLDPCDQSTSIDPVPRAALPSPSGR